MRNFFAQKVHFSDRLVCYVILKVLGGNPPSQRKMTSLRRCIAQTLDDAGPTPADHRPAFGSHSVGREFVLRRDDDVLHAHMDGLMHEARMLDGSVVDDEERMEIIEVVDKSRDDHLPGTVFARGPHGIYHLAVYATGQYKRARVNGEGQKGDRDSSLVIMKDTLRQRGFAEVKCVGDMPKSIESVQIEAHVTTGSLSAPKCVFKYTPLQCMNNDEIECFQNQQNLAVRAEMDKRDICRVLIDGFNLEEMQLDEAREEVQNILEGEKTGLHRKILYGDLYAATVWYQRGEAHPPKDIVADDGEVQGRQINIPMSDGMSLAVILTIANPKFCIFPEGVGFHPQNQSKEAMRQKPAYIQSELKFYNRNSQCVW